MQTPSNFRQSYRDVVLLNDHLTLINGTHIEFGGVGKGYALEQLAQLLAPSERVIINF